MTPASALREAHIGVGQRVELASEHVSIVVLPGFGGRVASLVDRRSGREWLVQGRLPPNDVTRHASLYNAAVAWGWDECLPTVAPCPDPRVPGGMLRDHGDVWGRPVLVDRDGDSLRLAFDVDDPTSRDGWTFRRTVRVEDRTVRVDYALENRGRGALPILWSMHPLVALEPGSTFHLPGVTDVLATFAAGRDVAGLLPDGRPTRIGWPAPRPEPRSASSVIHRLEAVPPRESRVALKLYAGRVARGTAAVSAPDGSWLGYHWDAATAPFLGVWISNGGWPAPETGVYQYALEPTTAAADSLDAAIAADEALVVAPGEGRIWWVTLEVGSTAEGLAGFLAGDLGTGTHESNPPAGQGAPR